MNLKLIQYVILALGILAGTLFEAAFWRLPTIGVGSDRRIFEQCGRVRAAMTREECLENV